MQKNVFHYQKVQNCFKITKKWISGKQMCLNYSL